MEVSQVTILTNDAERGPEIPLVEDFKPKRTSSVPDSLLVVV